MKPVFQHPCDFEFSLSLSPSSLFFILLFQLQFRWYMQCDIVRPQHVQCSSYSSKWERKTIDTIMVKFRTCEFVHCFFGILLAKTQNHTIDPSEKVSITYTDQIEHNCRLRCLNNKYHKQSLFYIVFGHFSIEWHLLSGGNFGDDIVLLNQLKKKANTNIICIREKETKENIQLLISKISVYAMAAKFALVPITFIALCLCLYFDF